MMLILIQSGKLSDHHGTCAFAKLFTSASGAFCQKDERKVKSLLFNDFRGLLHGKALLYGKTITVYDHAIVR